MAFPCYFKGKSAIRRFSRGGPFAISALFQRQIGGSRIPPRRHLCYFHTIPKAHPRFEDPPRGDPFAISAFFQRRIRDARIHPLRPLCYLRIPRGGPFAFPRCFTNKSAIRRLCHPCCFRFFKCISAIRGSLRDGHFVISKKCIRFE